MKRKWTIIVAATSLACVAHIYLASNTTAKATATNKTDFTTQQIIRNGKIESVQIKKASENKVSKKNKSSKIAKKNKQPKSNNTVGVIRSATEIKKSLNKQLALNDSFYTIQQGDTLSMLAFSLDVRTSYLVYLNQISDPDYILEGQKIKIH